MPCPICDEKPMNFDCTEAERRMYAEIEELREQMPRWISVSERLPEPGVSVLIFFRPLDDDGTPSCIGCDGKGGLITVAALDRIDGQNLWTSEYGDEVPSHWMPLPEPPTD